MQNICHIFCNQHSILLQDGDMNRCLLFYNLFLSNNSNNFTWSCCTQHSYLSFHLTFNATSHPTLLLPTHTPIISTYCPLDTTWLYLIQPDPTWPLLVPCDPTWPLLVLLDHIWPNLTPHDPNWSSRTHERTDPLLELLVAAKIQCKLYTNIYIIFEQNISDLSIFVICIHFY